MKDLIEALNTAHELDEGRRKQVKKSDVIKYLRSHQEVKLSKEDFDYIVDDLWNAICVEIRDGADYETIEDVNMGELMDAADNPTHDLCMRLLGFMDDEDDDEDEVDSSNNTNTQSFQYDADGYFLYDQNTWKGPWSQADPERVRIVDGVQKIKWGSFSCKKKLVDVIIPDSVTCIDDYAFQSSGLATVDIPGSVKEISEMAFWGCENLTKVNLRNGVVSIGKGAFMGCPRLTSITIPDSVTSIAKDAFVVWKLNDTAEPWHSDRHIATYKVTIHCSEGSYAHKYALENKIPVKLI